MIFVMLAQSGYGMYSIQFLTSVLTCHCVQLGEHERALRLLVHKLRDFSAAENYCLINSSETDVSERARLFHMLLSVYLDPNNELVLLVVFFCQTTTVVFLLHL